MIVRAQNSMAGWRIHWRSDWSPNSRPKNRWVVSTLYQTPEGGLLRLSGEVHHVFDAFLGSIPMCDTLLLVG